MIFTCPFQPEVVCDSMTCSGQYAVISMQRPYPTGVPSLRVPPSHGTLRGSAARHSEPCRVGSDQDLLPLPALHGEMKSKQHRPMLVW